MQFKKFTAGDMREALAAVKKELGADAMIVATRQVDGGMFKKPRLEVTAACAPAAVEPAATPQPTANVQRTYGRRAASGSDQVATAEDFAALTEAAKDDMGPPSAAQAPLAPDALRREVRALRSQMQQRDDDGQQSVLQEIASLRDMLTSLTMRGANNNKPNDALGDLLQAADVEPALSRDLIAAARVRAERNLGDAASPLLRDELVALKQVIAADLQVDTGFFAANAPPKRIALIGPTGVGKTTTIAKIAAHAALVHHRNVALISLDTYRVAAYEQLRQYACLMDVPLTIAGDAATFAAAIESYQAADLILIDTAGRGTADKSHHSHLCELFSNHRVQAYLALCAATRRLELRGILRAFAALDPQALVFTKLDEAMALGAIVNASKSCSIPMTFVTHGQRVPEDLSLPDATDLAARLVHTVLDSARPRPRSRTAPPAASYNKAPFGGYSDHDAI